MTAPVQELNMYRAKSIALEEEITHIKRENKKNIDKIKSEYEKKIKELNK